MKNKLKNSLNELTRFKFVVTLVLKFKETINKNETKYSILYSNSKAETIIHDSDINNVFEPIYNTIMTKKQKYHLALTFQNTNL